MTGARLKAAVDKVCPCGTSFKTAYKHKVLCERTCNEGIKYLQRIQDYKDNYGITIEDYNKLFERQNGCCFICLKHQCEFKRRLSVDHNHNTGAVRGLLCHKCNRAIGLLNEDVNSIKRALEYVS